MLDCICVETMRLSDAETIAQYVPSLELMQRAAMGVFRTASWYGRVAIVAGSGNNGGDGYALARILHQNGVECAVFSLGSKLSHDSAHYARLAREEGVPIEPFSSSCLDGFDMVVDCLLGTGFQGALRENYRAAIEAINTSGACVISVDINSGMNGDTGDAQLAVRSDLTVTIGYVKNGLVAEQAGEYMKRLVCVDIGIGLVKEENKICDESQWLALCEKNLIPVDERKANLKGVTYYHCPPWLSMNVIESK